jgi:5-methyltetrahydropteroyltriglutamate--homocysteine methyltransferase
LRELPPFRADHVGSLLRPAGLIGARVKHERQEISEPVAGILFNKVNVDGYLMEWDTERAGNFEPLRFSGNLESKDQRKRRIDAAAKCVDPRQLCLRPQCGFASTEEGNALTEDEQWTKLEMIVEVADEVWGSKESTYTQVV